MHEIKYRKDSDVEVYTCVIYVSTGTYRREAKIICAELGLLIKTCKVSTETLNKYTVRYRIQSQCSLLMYFDHCIRLGLGFTLIHVTIL